MRRVGESKVCGGGKIKKSKELYSKFTFIKATEERTMRTFLSFNTRVLA